MARAIGFLLKTYPKLSETFILNEILGLEAKGMALHIFSLQRPTDSFVHAANASVRAVVTYLPALAWRDLVTILFAHLQVFARHPLRYIATAMRQAMRVRGDARRAFLHGGCLAASLESAGIAHVHAHFATEPARAAEIAHRLIGTSFSISAHAKDIYTPPARLLRRTMRRASFVVTCTDYNRRHLIDVTGNPQSVVRMYHGIDLERFDATRTPPCVPEEAPPLILSIGRLREKKGFPTLIEACGQLALGGRRFRCEIVGYGPDAEALQTAITARGLGKVVVLVGKLPQDAVIERYRQAHLFVLPCQVAADGDRDGIPNVLLEAMAMRVPVISTPVSGIPEAIENGVNGLLVPAEDAMSLANAMRTLLDSSDLRAVMGEAGHQTVKRHFSNESNLELVRGLLLNVKDGRRRDDSEWATQNGYAR